MDRAEPTHVCGIAALDVARVSGRGFKPQKIVRGISKALFYEIPCDPGSRHPNLSLNDGQIAAIRGTTLYSLLPEPTGCA